MKGQQCILSGNTVTSLEKAYDELSRQLEFPECFGQNLDALWDVLSTDIYGPFTVIWEKSEKSRDAMGDDYDRLVSLFRDVAKFRDDFLFQEQD